jgi:hypothetical protein
MQEIDRATWGRLAFRRTRCSELVQEGCVRLLITLLVIFQVRKNCLVMFVRLGHQVDESEPDY